MQPALAQVCSLSSPFDQDLVEYAAGKCPAVEVWLTKLENFVQSQGLDAVRRLVDEQHLQLPVGSYQGGILASQGEARREAWELFRRRLALCRDVGIPTLVVAADIVGPLEQQLVDRVMVSLRQAAAEAEAYGVRLAIEFQASAAFMNNLQTAAAVLAELNLPQLGICLDTFHWYVGPSKLEDLGYLSPANLFHVQLCDLADVPREFAADAQRILPGEGDLPIAPIVEHLQRIGYTGHVSVELMNPQLWQVPPRQLGEIAITALRRVLGQAS